MDEWEGESGKNTSETTINNSEQNENQEELELPESSDARVDVDSDECSESISVMETIDLELKLEDTGDNDTADNVFEIEEQISSTATPIDQAQSLHGDTSSGCQLSLPIGLDFESPNSNCDQLSEKQESLNDDTEEEQATPDFFDSMILFEYSSPRKNLDLNEREPASPEAPQSNSFCENDELEPLLKISQVFSCAESDSGQNKLFSESTSTTTEPVSESSIIETLELDVDIPHDKESSMNPKLGQSESPLDDTLHMSSSPVTESPVIIDLDRYDDDGSHSQHLCQNSFFHNSLEESPQMSSSITQTVPTDKDNESSIYVFSVPTKTLSAPFQQTLQAMETFNNTPSWNYCNSVFNAPEEDKLSKQVIFKTELDSPQIIPKSNATSNISFSSVFPSKDPHSQSEGSHMTMDSLSQAYEMKSNVSAESTDTNSISYPDNGFDWDEYHTFSTDVFDPDYMCDRPAHSCPADEHPSQATSKFPHLDTDNKTNSNQTNLASQQSRPEEFYSDSPTMLQSSFGQVAMQNTYGKPFPSSRMQGNQMCFQNDRLDGYLWAPQANPFDNDLRNISGPYGSANQLPFTPGNIAYDPTPTFSGQTTFAAPIIDDEETDDADEFDDMPVSFSQDSESAMSFQSKQSSSCYWSDDSSLMNPLTPSTPSTSSTPAPSTSSVETFMPDTPGFGPWSGPNPCIQDNSGYPSPMPRQPFTIEPNLIDFDLPLSSFRPYPSMADAMCSARGSRSSAGKKKSFQQEDRQPSEPYTKQRKNQIQSDKISTSTGKSTRGRKKARTPGKRDLMMQERGNQVRPEGAEQDEPLKSRHNEPLNQHAINIMLQWFQQNVDNPYPSKADKEAMARMGSITENQVKSWFANKRNRTNNTKPKVQKRAMEEKLKELCLDLERNHHNPLADNTHIIQQLSGIIQHCNVTRPDQHQQERHPSCADMPAVSTSGSVPNLILQRLSLLKKSGMH